MPIPPAAPTPTAPRETAASRRSEDDARGFESALAVMQLMQGLQASDPAAVGALPEDAVFEDANADANDVRREALNEDQARTRQAAVPSRPDARADAADVSRSTIQPPRGFSDAGAAPAAQTSASASDLASPEAALGSHYADQVARSDAGSATVKPATTPAVDTPAPQPSAATAVQPTPQAGVVRTADRVGDSPARQVAQILGAARGGGAESANQPAAVGGPATRPSNQAGGRSFASGGGTQGEASSAGSSAQSEGGEVESAGRTPFERLIRSVRTQVGPKVSSARLVLDPPELGRLDVQVRMEAGRLSVGVRTESAEARELLKLRGEELRTALEQHGIRLERFDVALESEAAWSTLADRGYGSGRGRAEERPSGGRASREESIAATTAPREIPAVGDTAPSHDPARRLDVRI